MSNAVAEVVAMTDVVAEVRAVILVAAAEEDSGDSKVEVADGAMMTGDHPDRKSNHRRE